MTTPIGVGLVGASPDRGWVKVAHVPALAHLNAYAVRAVSTTRRSSAEAMAHLLGADLGFDNHGDLIRHPAVDLVVVGVKVTDHHAVVAEAIDAGKMVYCEWPLGRNLAEAEDLAQRARDRGVRTVVGLQGRHAAAVRHAKALISQGYIGTPISTNLRGFAPDDVWIGRLDPHYEFMNDPASGATLQAIVLGHVLDMLADTLGEFTELSALLSTQRPEAIILQNDRRVPRHVPDEVAVHGLLDTGMAASVHYSSGRSHGQDFHWEIRGTAGSLHLTARDGYANMADLVLHGQQGEAEIAPIAVPQHASEMTGPPANVSALYAQFARDLAHGTRTVPDFDTALRHHRVLDAIERSDRQGARRQVGAK